MTLPLLQDQFHLISIITINIPSTVNQLLIATTLLHSLPVANWFTVTNFLNKSDVNHVEQINGLVHNENTCNNEGLANLLKFSSIQIKVGL